MAAKEKSKLVIYHAPFAAAKLFSVLKENADGTVDIGTADGPVLVRGCKVTDKPVHGHVTLQAAEETPVQTPPDAGKETKK